MEEEMQFIVDNAKESMQLALNHLEKEMLNIRAGKANPLCFQVLKLIIMEPLLHFLKLQT